MAFSTLGTLGRRFSLGAVGLGPSLGPYTANVKPSNTAGFRATYRAGARNVRVAFIGDSTTRGQSTGGGTSQAVNSWPMQLSTLLNAAGVNSGANNVWSDGGSWGLGQTISNFLTGDSRVSIANAVTLGSVLSAGGNNFAMAAAAALSFVPQASCNTADIIWRDGATGRNFNWQVDGGSTTQVNSTNVTQFGVNSVALGSVASHTLTLNWVAGSVSIIGVSAYNNTRKELTLWNWGICGATSANLINNVDTAVGRLAILAHSALKPDLAFIEGGLINDWRTSVAVATSKANLTTLVATIKTNGGDVILCTPTFDAGSTGLTAQQQTYVDAMYQVAAEQNVGLLDFRKIAPERSDNVHMTTAGHLAMATAARDVVLRII